MDRWEIKKFHTGQGFKPNCNNVWPNWLIILVYIWHLLVRKFYMMHNISKVYQTHYEDNCDKWVTYFFVTLVCTWHLNISHPDLWGYIPWDDKEFFLIIQYHSLSLLRKKLVFKFKTSDKASFFVALKDAYFKDHCKLSPRTVYDSLHFPYLCLFEFS